MFTDSPNLSTALPIIGWSLALIGFAGTMWPYFAPAVRPDHPRRGRPTSITIAIASTVALVTAGVINLTVGGGVLISAYLIGGGVASLIIHAYQVRDYRRRVELVAESTRLRAGPS